MLINYSHVYPNVKICCHARDMIRHVKPDADYLVIPGAHSRIAGHHCLSNNHTNNINPSDVKPNWPIITQCKNLRHIVGSSAEADTGGLFINAHHIVQILTALLEIYHIQPKNPLKSENFTYKGYSTFSMRQNWSKLWDMRFHWSRNRYAQEHLKDFWEKWINKNSDYFT